MFAQAADNNPNSLPPWALLEHSQAAPASQISVGDGSPPALPVVQVMQTGPFTGDFAATTTFPSGMIFFTASEEPRDLNDGQSSNSKLQKGEQPDNHTPALFSITPSPNPTFRRRRGRVNQPATMPSPLVGNGYDTDDLQTLYKLENDQLSPGNPSLGAVDPEYEWKPQSNTPPGRAFLRGTHSYPSDSLILPPPSSNPLLAGLTALLSQDPEGSTMHQNGWQSSSPELPRAHFTGLPTQDLQITFPGGSTCTYRPEQYPHATRLKPSRLPFIVISSDEGRLTCQLLMWEADGSFRQETLMVNDGSTPPEHSTIYYPHLSD